MCSRSLGLPSLDKFELEGLDLVEYRLVNHSSVKAEKIGASRQPVAGYGDGCPVGTWGAMLEPLGAGVDVLRADDWRVVGRVDDHRDDGSLSRLSDDVLDRDAEARSHVKQVALGGDLGAHDLDRVLRRTGRGPDTPWRVPTGDVAPDDMFGGSEIVKPAIINPDDPLS